MNAAQFVTMGPAEASSEPLSLGPRDLNDKCPHHDGLCVYDASSPDRCPWCHATWSVTLRSDFHSCEQRGLWPSRDRAWRVAKAAQMRAQAAQELDQGTQLPSMDLTPTPALFVPLSNSQQEVAS
jgi:hypothetical protein